MKLKFEKRILSFLLVLTMLVGFLPDIALKTGLSANAAVPTIKQGVYIRMGDYNGEDVDWFCAVVNKTGTLMLSKYVLKNMVFGSNATYKTSNIHTWLDVNSGGTFATELGLTEAEMSLVKQLSLSDGDGTDQFIIPSYDELKGTSYTKAKYIYNKNATAGAYWLRTKRDNSNPRVVRSQYAKVDQRYSNSKNSQAVRPMFYLDTNVIKNLAYTGSGTETDPYMFESRYSINSDFTTGGSFEVTATRENSSIYKGEWKGSQHNKLVKDAAVTLTPKPTEGFRLENISATKRMGSDVDAPFTPLSGTDGMDGEKYTNLVDKNKNTKWCLNFNSNNPPYIIIKANNMMTMKSYTLTTADDTANFGGRNWQDWTIYGANFSSDQEAVKDSSEWKVVTSVTNDTTLQAANYTKYNYSVNTTTPYQYYMLKVTASKGANLIQMSEFALQGDAFENIPLTQTNGNYSFTMPEANVNIHAEFEGDLHFVTKDVNDTWTERNEDKTTFTSASYTVTDDIANKYNSAHYVFKGYSTSYSDDGAYTAASAGQTLDLTSSKGNLYLYYELERYNLTLYQDIAGTKTYKTDSLPYGRTLDNYANEKPAEQAHDTFAGWSESLNQSTYSQEALVNWDGQTMTADKTVYPIWVHDKVNVKKNQGYGDTATESSFVDLDSTLTLETPTRDGYTFDGWYTQNGTKWDNSWSITPEFCDKDKDEKAAVQTDSTNKYNYYTLTLTAHWTPKTAEIVYNLGDHASSAVPNNGSVAMGGTAILENAPVPKDGYLFKGWKINDTLYSAGGSFTLSDWSIVSTNNNVNTITLTADYVERTKVKLFFNTNGGTAIEPITQYVDESVNLGNYSTIRTGYTFNNWTVGNTTYASGDTFTVPTSTDENNIVTFNANWTVDKHTITFDSLGGSAVSSITQDYGISITEPDAPTRAHYEFKGWYPSLPATMPAEDITLNAIWEPIEYTITFQGGDSTPAVQKGVYGAAVNTPTKPTKEGYDFDGWRDSNNTPVTFPIYISGDATYTAAWKKKVSYTVTFEVENGKWNDNKDDMRTVTLNGYEGDELKLTAENIPAVGDFPNENYKVGEWDTIPDVTTRITESKTYKYTYAKKQKISATVTFKVANGSWDDDTKADKIVTLEAYEGNTLKLTENQIPKVGEKPDTNCIGGDWDITPDIDEEITENKTYTYTYEKMAVVTKAPTAKTLTYNKNAQALVTAGTAEGGTMMYCISESTPEESATLDSNGNVWSTQIPSETNAGQYTVWYTAAGNEGYTNAEVASIKVDIKQANPIVKFPTAKNQTYYNNTVQLINAGTVEDGCTIEYQLGTNSTVAPTGTWETDATKITANQSGTFYVWYEATGNTNYANVAATCITVKISQYTVSPKSSQTWTLTMDSYPYDGTAHEAKITGNAYGKIIYYYYNADTDELLDQAPSEVGNYRVRVYASGSTSYYSRSQTAEYSITNPVDPIDENGMASVEKFKNSDTIPTVEGKIFAGWFTDETCTTAYTEDTGKAYAKFIDENILTVKAQISSSTTANSEKTSIRFITSVDSLKYQNVGFKITYNGKTIDKQMTKVYTALNANGKKISPKVFSEESNYMEAYTLNNIPQSAFGKEFTVTPYYTTQDGTIVEGKTNTFTIANMIK